MLDQFQRGELNLSRLNCGLISLIPKMKEANNIKQYKPICLLGVDYKRFTKVLTRRLTNVHELTISKNQNNFYSRENILECVVILHEALHKLMRRGKGLL
jgi:hypothetical protein